MKNAGLEREERTLPAPLYRTAAFPCASSATPPAVGAKVVPPVSIQPIAERFPALEEQTVVLTFRTLEARDVRVAGDFNGWRPEATPLTSDKIGEWTVRLPLRSGRYEYRFVVDGLWMEDPEAGQRAVNPHGGFNSVVVVPLAVRTSLL